METFINPQVYDFPIERQKLYTPSGQYADREAIVRTDTNQILGVVSEDYNLLHHRDAVQSIMETIPQLGECQINRVYTANHGARLYMDLMFPQERFEIAKRAESDTDTVSPRLIMSNSYDGQLRFGFALGAWRFVCSNGLRIGSTIFEVTHKHTAGMGLNDILNKAQKALDFFKNKALPRYKELSNEPVNLLETLEMFVGEKILPEGLVRAVALRIGQRRLNVTNNWELYNEFTYELTHVYKKSDERRETLQVQVAKAFRIGI